MIQFLYEKNENMFNLPKTTLQKRTKILQNMSFPIYEDMATNSSFNKESKIKNGLSQLFKGLFETREIDKKKLRNLRKSTFSITSSKLQKTVIDKMVVSKTSPNVTFKNSLNFFILLLIITIFPGINKTFALEKQFKLDRLDRTEDIRAINANFDDIYRFLNYANVNISTAQKDLNILSISTASFQTLLNLLAASTTQTQINVYNLQMSTIPGAVDWTAATTTFVNVTGDTMTGALKTAFYMQVSTTLAGLKRIEWADGSVTTFAVVSGATSADLTAFKTLVGNTTNWIGISTGTERTDRIAADALIGGTTAQIALSTGTVLPLNGSKAMTGNLDMGTKNITNTSTHTVNTLNVTQINWADGQVSSTSHIGDLTADQADARYIKKTGGDSVFGSLKTTYYMQVSTTIAGLKRIEWADGSAQSTSRGYPSILIAAANAPQRLKDRADFVCDGTNDEAEFNMAISSLSTTGGIVDGANGNFNMVNLINLVSSSITLRNFSFNLTGEYGTGIYISSVTNVVLENISINSLCNIAEQGIIQCAVAFNANKMMFNNVNIIGTWSGNYPTGNIVGFYFSRSQNITLNNSFATGDIGFQIISSTNVIISNCRAINCVVPYKLTNNKNILFSNNIGIGSNDNILDFSIVANSNYVQGKWIAPTLLNSWVNVGGDTNAAGYYKDNEGIVHLRGLVKNGVSAIIFNLPAGYRPENTSWFPCESFVSGNYVLALINVTSTGNVTQVAGNSSEMGIDGISFRAFQ